MATLSLPVVADAGLSRYIQSVNDFPMLEEKEEYMLAKAWQEHEDIKAAQKLVTSHLRLVVKIAMGFRGYGLPVAELISEGNIGLMQAVKKFDPEKGFRLSTYAMWWIKSSIQEYVLRSWSLVRMGTTAAQKKLFFNLRRIKNRITSADRDLSPDEVCKIASDLDVSEYEVVNMGRRLSGSDQSLNKTFADESGEEWISFLADDDANQEDLLAESQESSRKHDLMLEAMEQLNEREKHIINERRLKENPATLDDLSKVYKISRERVRQIESRAMEKMQLAVNKD